MFSLSDLEDKLLRQDVAQIAFILALLLFAYEWVSDTVQYYRLHGYLKNPVPPAVTYSHQSGKQSSLQKILRLPVFGDYIPKALVDLDVKPSGLNLLLVGIVLSSNQQESQAIISVQGGDTRSFSIGDAVPGGAKIKQITADGVLLEHGGELESLSLPKNELTFEPMPEPLRQEH